MENLKPLLWFSQLVYTIFTKQPIHSPQSQMLPTQVPDWAILLTDCFVRRGQRVRIRFTPAHWEDVHGFNINNKLWSRSLQTCIGKVKTTDTNRFYLQRHWGRKENTWDWMLNTKPTVVLTRAWIITQQERRGSNKVRVWKREVLPTENGRRK